MERYAVGMSSSTAGGARQLYCAALSNCGMTAI
jgi:hypothetical protein